MIGFDNYSIRARISAFIFLISPFLLDAYIFIDAVRTFSSTIIILIISYSASCFFVSWIRYRGNKIKQTDYIAQFLLPTSTEVNSITKTRYLNKLTRLEPSFANLVDYDDDVVTELYESVSEWLKQQTRDDNKFKLVHEENINYGFLRNTHAVKSLFLWTFSVYSMILIIKLFFINVSTISAEYIACFFIHLTSYLIWILGITNKLLEFAAKKYALSVLKAIDEL